MLVASPRFEPEPCRIAIVRCEAEAWEARDRPARGNSLTVTAKAQRPPVGGGTDRQHGWQGTDPLCWRYAVSEILVIVAQFRKLRLGSGPRNRVHGTPSRPLTKGPQPTQNNRQRDIRLYQTRPEERRIQEVRGFA